MVPWPTPVPLPPIRPIRPLLAGAKVRIRNYRILKKHPRLAFRQNPLMRAIMERPQLL